MVFLNEGKTCNFILILFQVRPSLQNNHRFQQYSCFALLAGQITGIGLRAINSTETVLKLTGHALSRINYVMVPVRTVSQIFSEII